MSKKIKIEQGKIPEELLELERKELKRVKKLNWITNYHYLKNN